MFANESSVQAQIRSTHGAELKKMTDLHDAVAGMMTVDKWTVPKAALADPMTVAILRHLLTKAIVTYRSIQLLCERGFHGDANALIRVLLETTAATMFILQRRRRDPKTKALTPNAGQRALGFHMYGLCEKRKMLNEWKQTPGLKRRAKKRDITQTQRAIDEIDKQLPAGHLFEKHWSGKGSFQNVMKSLRYDILYSVLYRFTSSIGHGSDVGSQFDVDPATDDIVWLVGPAVGGFEGPAAMACILLYSLADRVNTRLRLGFDLEPAKP